jgi:ABC-type transport system involved in multi-copper enzyme maturation permease subunit
VLSNIILREIHQHILSLRLHLTLILVFILFGLGSVAFIKGHTAARESYEQVYSTNLEREKEWAGRYLGNFMVRTRSLILAPRSNAFITDAKEKMMPNQFWYTGFSVQGFDVPSWASNDLIKSFAELNWVYIVSIIVGFTVLLFSYDLVSGDKENGTLALTVSYPVSRGVLLTGKYISVIIVAILVLLPGIVLSLIILLLSSVVVFDGMLLAEIAGFLAGAALFVACMAALGLLASIISTRSNVSLLICLCFWLGSVVVVPNSAVFFTDKLFPIESSQSLDERISQEVRAANDRIDDAMKAARGSDLSFEDYNRLYAKFNIEYLQTEKKIKGAWNNSLFLQFSGSRQLAAVSPVSLFEQMSEAVVGGGLVRLRKCWSDIKLYQAQLFEWFKDVDADDPQSMHLYDPYNPHFMTHKVVDFETIPQFRERRATFTERLESARLSLALLVIYTAIAFALSFVLFLRYDVR